MKSRTLQDPLGRLALPFYRSPSLLRYAYVRTDELFVRPTVVRAQLSRKLAPRAASNGEQ